MHKIQLPPPEGQTLGQAAFDYDRAFPEGYMFPVQSLIREAFIHYREQFEQGAEFTIPRYGVLRTKGRAYTFLPEQAYAGIKGYPDVVEGSWG